MKDVDAQGRDLALQSPGPPAALEHVAWALADSNIGPRERQAETLIGQQPELVFGERLRQRPAQLLGVAAHSAAGNSQRSRVERDLHGQAPRCPVTKAPPVLVILSIAMGGPTSRLRSRLAWSISSWMRPWMNATGCFLNLGCQESAERG